MQQFRIMPAQRPWPARTTTRYGFPIFDHPLQDPKAGFYVASWDTREKAQAAACCLGYLPNVVVPIAYVIPDPEKVRWDWRVQ